MVAGFYYYYLLSLTKLTILTNDQKVRVNRTSIIDTETVIIRSKNRINRSKHLQQHSLSQKFHIEKSRNMLPIKQISKQTNLLNLEKNKL